MRWRLSGMKGMRVQSIIRELRGEKIDIIEYHEDAVTFAEKSAPARQSQPRDGGRFGEKHLEVVVDDTQLSLAIGKKRSERRLAAKLLAEDRYLRAKKKTAGSRAADVGDAPQSVHGPSKASRLGRGLVEKLKAAGVTTVESLADMTPEQLDHRGIGPNGGKNQHSGQ